MTDDNRVLVEQLVEERIAAAVSEAVEKTRQEMEEKIVLERMHLMDPTHTEGATLLLDNGVGYTYAHVPLDKIASNPLSERAESDLDPETLAMQELITGIRASGGLNRSLLVYRKDDGYMLVKGARRVAALRAMGEEVAPAYIMPYKPPEAMEREWVNGY